MVTEEENCIQPRPYQTLMKEVCVKQNTIIYLPTGAGKTFIAVMVIKHFGKALEKPLTEGGKRTIMVLNTVALARQQFEVLQDTLPYQVGLYSGELQLDHWKQDRWRLEFSKNQVVVATCQIIVDVINHGFLSVSDINVLVLDECHSGTGDHPMHQLMSKFEGTPKHLQPRVIGLTGILLNNPSPLNVEEELERLETVFQGTIATVENSEDYELVMSYSTDPVELSISFEDLRMTPLMQKIINTVDELLRMLPNFQLMTYRNQNMRNLKQDIPKKAKEIKALFSDFKYQVEDLGIYGASIAILAVIVELELQKLQCESVREQKLYQAAITKAEEIRHDLDALMAQEESEYNKLMKFGSQKLICLVQYLQNYVDENPRTAENLKCLVFVQRRHSAKVIYHILKKVFLERFEDDPEPQIRSDFMVGRMGLPESIEAILSDKNQRKTVTKFKKNETNLIVASSVLEEGIDVQSCNLVIRFDLPMHFRSYVQTKGRARMKDSRYLMMIPKSNETTYLKKLQTFKLIEARLKECLVGKTINRKPPLEKDIAEELYNDLIPPFKTSSGAILTAVGSLSLLNRYAMLMPHDRFTNTSVYWERVFPVGSNPNAVAVKLLMPIQSSVKGMIQSGEFENLKLAKRHAAFLACKQLYLNGELSENLLPIDQTKKMADVKTVYFEHWDNYANDNPKTAGTAENRRMHDMKFPEELRGCTPQAGSSCLMYIIKVEPLFGSTFEMNGVEDKTRPIFHELLGNGNTWAILTTKLLPNLAPMSFFFTQGESRVTIIQASKEVAIDSAERLEQLRGFHSMVFRDILRVSKKFFVFDREGQNESYLIAPTRKGDIDWDLVSKFQALSECKEIPELWRKKMTFNPEDYLYQVIQPWYKIESPKYIVTAVRTDKTPYSPFPEPEYESYAAYFEKKYHKRIQQPNQFMLETKGITSDLKLLHPGAGKDGASAKISSRSLLSEFYIPELCHNYMFPADLWLKAVLLPSVCHRLRILLLAENMRVTWNRNLGVSDPSGYMPAPLSVDKRPQPNQKEPLCLPGSDDDEEMEELNQLQVTSQITFPNADRVPPTPISNAALESFCDVVVPWRESDEPIDIHRNWDVVHAIEIDYYVRFISQQFEDMKIEHYVTPLSVPAKTGDSAFETQQLRRAIQDTPRETKMKLDLLDVVPRAPQQADVVKAFTACRSGDVFDNERFEVLGDAFLKFAVSLYLIHRHENWHEGYLTTCKGKIVSNRNLFYIADQLQIPGMIKVHKFDPEEWVPPLFKVPSSVKTFLTECEVSAQKLYKLNLSPEEIKSGNISKPTEIKFLSECQKYKKSAENDGGSRCLLEEQRVADKTVADCMEALLGVYLSSLGIEKSLNLLSYWKILPADDLVPRILQTRMESGMAKSKASPEEVDEQLFNFRSLEQTIGYTFKDRSYLLQALTHASYPTNSVTGCYQELEFIGDAILDFLISSYIFQRCGQLDPGQITDLRSALVNNTTLACITVRNRIHLYILQQNAVLQETITKFVAYQKANNNEVTDQVQLLITENDNKCLADFVDVPKVLGDVFESLIGAIFFDSGNDLRVTWGVIYRLMEGELDRFITNVPKQLIRRLYEWPNSQPKFGQAVAHEDFVTIKLRFSCKNEVIEVNGFGQNKADAKRAAAKAALHLLERANK